MKRFFFRQLSLVLVIAMLLSLTGVAENDGSMFTNDDDALTANEIALEEADLDVGAAEDVVPEVLGDINLLPDILLEDGNISAPGEPAGPMELPDPAETLAPDKKESTDPPKATGENNKKTVPKKLTLGKGETYDFGIKNATITTNKKSIVSVDKKKKIIKAEGTGSAKITVKSGKKTYTCKVTVLKAPGSVTLSIKKLTLPATDTYKLKVSFPNKTASNKLTWKSSNKKVATVDENGIVTGVKKGTAKITVTTFNKKSTTCKVTVNNDPANVSFPMESITIGKGESVMIKPEVNKGAKPKYTWKSKKKTVATVDKNGKITGKKAGSSTTITVETQNGKKATLKVNVMAAPGSVTLSDATVEVGSTVQLKAKLKSKTASYKLTWKSSDKKIATVDKNGVVKGIRAGTVTITVTTFNKKSATCKVTVKEKPTVTPTPASVVGTITSLTIKFGDTVAGNDTVVLPDSPVTASWVAEGDVASYAYEIKKANGESFTTGNGTSYVINADALTAGEEYTLTVKAIPTNGTENDATTATAKFKRNAAPVVGTITSLTIKFGDTVAGNDTVVLPDSPVTASWVAEGDVASYSYQVTDASGNVVASENAVQTSSYEIAAGTINAGEVYTLKVGAMPTNGEDADFVWKTTQFKRNAAPAMPSTVVITNVNCSVDGEIPLNRTVLWAVSADADSDVQYEFILLRRTKEVAHQNFSAKNYFRYSFSQSGDYTLKITCQDEDGNKADTVLSHTVQADTLTIVSISTKSLERILGEEIVWQVETYGGHEPLTYSYALSFNGSVIDSVESSESASYRYIANQAGEYVLSVTCVDTDATIASLTSDAVVVVCTLDMPIIKNNFSGTEINAPDYKNDSMNVEWQNVTDASAYNIVLSQKNGNDYVEVLKTSVSAGVNRYVLQQSLFADITQKTLYKLSLSATGVGESEADVKYFNMLPINTDLTVDSKSAITWDQASAYSSVRNFAVSSDLPWTAMADVAWLSCKSVDDARLSVSIGERTSYSGVRTGHIVVSNGHTSVTITVNQNTRSKAPEFEYPKFSTDSNSPTTVAAGPFPFRYKSNDHSYVVMRIYELESGRWVFAKGLFGGSSGILGNNNYIVFKDKTNYKFELIGVYSNAYGNNEILADALTTTYYAYMDADRQVMTVNGVESLTSTINDKLDVDVYSTNLWSVNTDANWITLAEAPTNRTYQNNYTITAEANTTGSARTGHVYFTTGLKTATVTLTQPNTSTEIIYPANISQNMNNPTILTHGTTIRLGSPELIYAAAILENGSWRNAYDYESDIVDATMKFELKDADQVDGKVVRLTFSNGINSSTYYVKVKMPSSSPYVMITTGSSFSNDRLRVWEAQSTRSTLSIKLKANTTWTATSNSSWLTISSSSGSSTSEQTLTVTVAANTSGAIRVGEIAFANNGVNCSWLKVTQNAGDYIKILNKDTRAAYDSTVDYKHENGDRHSIDLAISCNSRWSAQSNDSWITFASEKTSITDSSSTRTSLYTSQNVTSSSRTGSVTFTCGPASSTVYITQERYMGKPVISTPTWSISPSNPTLTTYEDVTVKWSAVNGATYYEVSNDQGLHSDTDKWMTVNETGKSSYSVVLPMDWFAAGTDAVQYITMKHSIRCNPKRA